MKVGWVGPGIMGSRMLRRLGAAGHEVHVYARSSERARTLAEAGLVTVAGLGELADRDVVFTMLPGPAEIESVVLGTAGLLAVLGEASTIVDMSTSSPALAERIATEGHARGIAVLDAPVSGGPSGAEDGTLSIMVGGDGAALRTVEPLLNALGSRIVYFGAPGNGQRAKLVNQILVAATTVAVAEAFTTARDLGLDGDRLHEALGAGVAASPLLHFIWQKLSSDDEAPGFRVEHMLKDVDLLLAEAARVGAPLPLTAVSRTLFAQTAGNKPGAGTQAVADAVGQKA
jgi:3-hydroxyisobutyrate dehydrogenase